MERTSIKKNLALLHNEMRLCTRLCNKMDKIAWPKVTAYVLFHFPRKLAYSPPPPLYIRTSRNVSKQFYHLFTYVQLQAETGGILFQIWQYLTDKVLVNPTYHCSPSLLNPTLNSPFCLPRQSTNRPQKWLKQITTVPSINMVAYSPTTTPRTQFPNAFQNGNFLHSTYVYYVDFYSWRDLFFVFPLRCI